MHAVHDPRLVGLVANGGFVAADGRDTFGPGPGHAHRPEGAPDDPELVGLVAFGGFMAANGPDTFSPNLGHMHPPTGAPGNLGLVGLVANGGFRPADGPVTFSHDEAATWHAPNLLHALQGAGFTLDLSPTGALLVSPASALTEADRLAIRRHRDALVGLILAQRQAAEDDRRTCRQCRHLRSDGRCAQAARGRLPGASRRLEPVPDLLQRCEGFQPLQDVFPAGADASTSTGGAL